MITVTTKPNYITADVVGSDIIITTAVRNKKIRITAKYKCCYQTCTEITFK